MLNGSPLHNLKRLFEDLSGKPLPNRFNIKNGKTFGYSQSGTQDSEGVLRMTDQLRIPILSVGRAENELHRRSSNPQQFKILRN